MDGRKLLKLNDLPKVPTNEELIFRDEQNYSFEIKGLNINLSTFIRLGLKHAKFDGGNITNSIFENVYAKRASFSNIDFKGTIFKDCNFEKATFNSCNFKYCSFVNCLLPIYEIISCLPKEPNLRKEIANNIKVNYSSMGKRQLSDIFLDIQIKAEQEERIEIFRCRTSYYKERYGNWERVSALFSYILTRLSELVWGYGHRLGRLLSSYFVIMIIFASLIYLKESKFTLTNVNDLYQLTFRESLITVFAESIQYTYISFIPFDSFSKIILFAVRFSGIIYLGLLGASLFRKINK